MRALRGIGSGKAGASLKGPSGGSSLQPWIYTGGSDKPWRAKKPSLEWEAPKYIRRVGLDIFDIKLLYLQSALVFGSILP